MFVQVRASLQRWQALTGGRSATGVAALFVAFATLAAGTIALGQTAAPDPAATSKSATGAAAAAAEITSQETQPAFKLQVQRNLVVVRVVVRDAQGHPVAGLKQDDFRLFDNKKPQVISHFSEETPPQPKATGKAAGSSSASGTTHATESAQETPISLPQRFLALYFDDVHMAFDEIAQTRKAAEHYFAASLTPGDRAGIFTASGQRQLDFTDDRAKLHDALAQLFTRSVVAGNPNEDACPKIYPYQAYLFVERHDPNAISIANEEAFQCQCLDRGDTSTQCQNMSQRQAESTAFRILELTESQVQYDLRGLDELVRRLAVRPGQRSVVVVSPGFLTLAEQQQLQEITDRALRSNVVINTLDSRGLYAPVPLGDASHNVTIIPGRPDLMGEKMEMQLDNLTRDADVLRDLAADTGGVFFHNSNDFDQGFRATGAFPEVYYVLAFSPDDLKLDGHFHTLKVALVSPSHDTLQARRGYFAPTKLEDAATEVKEELEQAVFSQDELNALPLEVHTQFFKVDSATAKLSVMTHLDLRSLRFRKQEGRNLDNLTVITALFDPSGKYITAEEKTLEFRLLDTTLTRLARSGVNTKTSFDLKPGNYLVRQVVRDSGGEQMSALNRSVEIP